MKIEFTVGCAIGAKVYVEGSTEELPEVLAKHLVRINRAVMVPEEPTGGGGGVDERPALTTETAAPIVRRTRASKTV